MTPPPPADGGGAPAHGRTDGHDLGFDLPQPAKLSRSRATMIAVTGAVVLASAFAIGYLPRRAAAQKLALSTAAEDTTMRVAVVTPKPGSSDHAIMLPGTVQPLEETTIYARATGYVRKWYVDIGDKVADGQLLADLETPELDQELDQARAQLAQAQASLVQAKANRELSRTNLSRYSKLAPSGVVSQAELDQRQAMAQVDDANVQVAEAAISAQQANIRRLTQLKAFAHVTAPFAGTITARSIETGSLVTAGNGPPMYKIASMDPARVFVQVPQDVAPGVKAGEDAKVTVREYPGRTFAGKVARAAGELDPATRTMTTEVRVPNGDGALIAGMYAEVSLELPTPHRVYEIPATALMSDSHGERVAVVADDGTIKLANVAVERDTGPTIEIASGLTGNERIAKIGSAQFVDGMHVEVIR